MALGELLRDLRGTRKVAEVATRLKVGRAVVYMWESSTGSRRLPSAPNLQRLLDLYDATPDQRLEVWRARLDGELEDAQTEPYTPVPA